MGQNREFLRLHSELGCVVLVDLFLLTARRNRKIKDHMHKASRIVVEAAKENGIGTIVIGSNRGWKQEVSLGNRTNQNFVSIPHRTLIEMIRYKAELEGIRRNQLQD